MLLGVTVTASDVYTVFDAESGKVLRHETVVVNDFTSTSIATDALKVGDVITSIKIGDVTYDVSRTFHLIDAMLNARVGNTVELGIVRDGSEMTVSIKITEAALTQVK